MMINYAHRGASSYYPENTLSAFYAGVFMGADGIETDVQRTKDGVLVLFHDDTLDRVTNGTGRLCDHTYAQLQALTVKNPAGDRFDKIVTLEDFLRYFGWRQLTFAVELKQPGVERETIDLLETFGMAEKTILVDPGHGGTFPGRVNENNVLEKDINLQIALKLEQYLTETGANVLLSRRTDTDLVPDSAQKEKLLKPVPTICFLFIAIVFPMKSGTVHKYFTILKMKKAKH